LLNIIAGTFSVGAPPIPPSSYESIATVTVGSGGASDITFSSIPSTFTHLQIRGILLPDSTSGNTNFLQFNADTGNNYSFHMIRNSSAVEESGSVARTGAISMYGGTSVAGAVIWDILDYKDTNKYKTVRGLGGLDDNTNGFINFSSGSWRNTNAISSIKIFNASVNLKQYSSLALYGIKGV
jgi:hypothetical protein